MSLDPSTIAKGIGTAADSLTRVQKFLRWWKSRRYPKPPIGHYGIVVGITTENDVLKVQLKNDFIATLKRQLEANPRLTVLELPEKISEEIQHSEDDARLVLEKTESVFLIFGQLRRRTWQGRDTFVLDSKSGVRHSPIQVAVQDVLAREMRDLLPGRRLISANNDLLEFELNAVTMDLSARYIIATAAYLSDQRAVALQLWDNLLSHLNAINEQPLNDSAKGLINTLKRKVKQNIVTSYLDEAAVSEFEWRRNRDVGHLDTMLEHLEAAERYRPKLYQAAILRALHSFVTKKNVKDSRKILMEFSSIGAEDPTWAFDMAFFYAYDGKLTQATGFYKKAFALNPDMRLVVEIEEWLLLILSEEPDKIQLHYCVGLVNYFGKRDFVKAKQDFEAFMKESEGKYPQQRRAVGKYLGQIEREEELLWDE